MFSVRILASFLLLPASDAPPVDGKLIFSKFEIGRFPKAGEIESLLQGKAAGGATASPVGPHQLLACGDVGRSGKEQSC